MADNDLYFHLLETRNAFKQDVDSIFSVSAVFNELKTEVYTLSGVNQQPTSFPCIYIDITDSSINNSYSSSTQIQRYTNFVVTFDIYSKDLKKLNQDDAVATISEYLISGLQKKYHSLRMTLNRPLPNLDITVSRWQVRFEGTMDNENYNIYSD